MSPVPAGRTGQAGRTEAGPVRWLRPSAKLMFLLALLGTLGAYTAMSFDLEWRTAAGRIGAGFFPRIIGIAGLVLTLVAVVRTIRAAAKADEEEDQSPAVEEDNLGQADLGRHPGALLFAVAAGAVLLFTLTTLGAILASALFLVVMLFFLNRGRPLLNIALAVAVPVGIYVLFQGMLNAGLPAGILPAL